MTGAGRERAKFDAISLELADLFQEWDVLHVYVDEFDRPADDEEYDDLVAPMRGWLVSGASPDELSRLLVEMLRRDYGLQIDSDLDELPFTTRLHTWWHSSPSE